MKKRRFYSDLVLDGILILIYAGVIFSCNGGGSGSEETGIPAVIPAVVGAQRDGTDLVDQEPAIEGIQYEFNYLITHTIILQLDGTVTPSETVIFKSSTLPSYLALDSNTGIITFTQDGSVHSDTVYFWSEGTTSGENTSATSLKIDFTALNS
ncbi:hypothetical protein [Marispirochaeta sp.]|uniref:hypothetical protein n=1 Tax=Marispirochaeta sp. TaxID=2038653 RepID=UPI0029C979E5|nr:hypothetical protein [Marispirochaeta sp.]